MNIFPNQADVPKERLQHLFNVLLNARTEPEIKELFELLQVGILAAYTKYFKIDPSNKSWLFFKDNPVIGRDGIADFQKIMSEGFTDFEVTYHDNYNQELFEGFLHWNHMFLFKFHQFTFQTAEHNDGILVFKGNPLQGIGKRPVSLNQYLDQALGTSKYWLSNGRDYWDYD